MKLRGLPLENEICTRVVRFAYLPRTPGSRPSRTLSQRPELWECCGFRALVVSEKCVDGK